MRKNLDTNETLSGSPPWMNYFVVALVAASLGIGGTWWLMPRHAQPTMIPLTPTGAPQAGGSPLPDKTFATSSDAAAQPPATLTLSRTLPYHHSSASDDSLRHRAYRM